MRRPSASRGTVIAHLESDMTTSLEKLIAFATEAYPPNTEPALASPGKMTRALRELECTALGDFVRTVTYAGTPNVSTRIWTLVEFLQALKPIAAPVQAAAPSIDDSTEDDFCRRFHPEDYPRSDYDAI
jgi:hypothetical protein